MIIYVNELFDARLHPQNILVHIFIICMKRVLSDRQFTCNQAVYKCCEDRYGHLCIKRRAYTILPWGRFVRVGIYVRIGVQHSTVSYAIRAQSQCLHRAELFRTKLPMLAVIIMTAYMFYDLRHANGFSLRCRLS